MVAVGRRRRGSDTAFSLSSLKRNMITAIGIFTLAFVATVGYALVAKTRAAWTLVLSEALIGFGYVAYTFLLSKLS